MLIILLNIQKNQKNLRNKFNSLEKDSIIISQKDKDKIILTARKTPLYMCIRDMYNDKSLNRHLHTACFYFIREYCYSSMFKFSKNGSFNVPYSERSYNFKYKSSKIKQMKSIEIFSYFQNTSIYNLDFEEFLNLFNLNENDFIFLDPPSYGISTRERRKNRVSRLFPHKNQLCCIFLILHKIHSFYYSPCGKNRKFMDRIRSCHNRQLDTLQLVKPF